MRKMHKGKGVLAGALLFGAWLPVSAAAPTVPQMLNFRPVQKGVEFSTPAAAEHDKCTVDLMKGQGNASGWVLKDSKGLLLRKYFDSNGDKYPDQWCYYKNGLEAYREADTNFNGKADQYRWMNAGGMKVGLDKNEDGTIDAWAALSCEELSQEVMKALVAKDWKQLETLLVADEDLKALGAPQAEINRINEVQKGAAAKFRQTCQRLAHLSESTRWLRVETSAPSRLPAETTGMKRDVLMHYRGTLMCETGSKHDWILLGEMVQIGETWKLIDAPMPGDAPTTVAIGGAENTIEHAGNAAVQPLLARLAELDKAAVQYEGKQDPRVVRYHLDRAGLIEQIVAKSDAADRGVWQQQLADSLSTAAQASPTTDSRALERLTEFAKQVAKDAPGSDVAAYVVFRNLSADYSVQIDAARTPDAMFTVQKDWLDRLAKFVAAYPKSDDKADALLQLGMINEFHAVGPEQKTKEGEAKKWYEQLARECPKTPQGLKAVGALRRLNLEGNRWELTAPVASLSGKAFNGIEQLRGKTVIVYYWSTRCPSAQADFARLKQLQDKLHSQGLEVVGISVDEDQPTAEAFVKKAGAPGYQLFAGGGLDSPLAAHYGLIVFPNLFIVNKDGKVCNRTAQIATIEDDVAQALK